MVGGLLLSSCRSPGAVPGTLYLTDVADRRTLIPVTPDTVCVEPNLVIVTHGWWEREPWPTDLALAIAAQTDPRQWRCGWYDWHREARRLRPWEATRIGRDRAGPYLGQEILRLSRQWRHIHLIGHSAGAWVIDAAALRIADETHADVHLTFLDAYVPDHWDESILGALARKSPDRCWAEQYFTRDFLFHRILDTPLTYAHNVDITDTNPGSIGHKFPWIWYRATVTGQYKPSSWFVGKTVRCRAGDIEYGFARSLEKDSQHWEQSRSLPAGGRTIRLLPE
ncbi:MAG: hypothetical protein JW955_17675 [Sedimentisphaerales bacterium]|nr:hypothetical protein [Sedimentisphaerales bacterium]